jgi:hypothetical protein
MKVFSGMYAKGLIWRVFNHSQGRARSGRTSIWTHILSFPITTGIICANTCSDCVTS